MDMDKIYSAKIKFDVVSCRSSNFCQRYFYTSASYTYAFMDMKMSILDLELIVCLTICNVSMLTV